MIDKSILFGTYDFPEGIPAFEEAKKILVTNIASIEGDVIAMGYDQYMFICIDPLIIKPDYKVLIEDDVKKFLKNTDEKDIAIICITTLGKKSSANLSGPIVLDTKSRIGLQICNRDKSVVGSHVRYEFDTNKIVGLDFLINYKITLKKNKRKKKDERTKADTKS